MSQCPVGADLFSGSGALGLESLSRGAEKVIMLELNATVMNQLRQHCSQLQADGALLVQEDALTWLASSAIDRHTIDIAFIDPPFDKNLWEITFEQLVGQALLAEDALIYIESPKAKALTIPPSWQLHRNKVSGDVHYALYKNSPGP
ncbi:MAG: RsmD family RNA methyltransferase [Pseudomonadota bacterium]